jgi:hypothetical protein
LLVAMRIVNGIETEMLQSEWENWLADENARCEHMVQLWSRGDVEGRRGDGDGDGEERRERREALKKSLVRYCGSCQEDQYQLRHGHGQTGRMQVQVD